MFRASSLPIIRSFLLDVYSALLSFMQFLMTASKQSQDVTVPSGGHQYLHETYQCRMYSGKLLMIDKEDDRNMYSFITE
jgi:hypothetical protein